MSKDIIEGSQAPDFEAATDGGGKLKLSSLKGKHVVLYFYSKDDTPGCTKESCGFAETHQDFLDKNAEVVGLSKDSVARHDDFKSKYGLPFTLVSDEDGAICEAYGTWVASPGAPACGKHGCHDAPIWASNARHSSSMTKDVFARCGGRSK